MGCNACKGEEKESEEDLANVGGARRGGKKLKTYAKRDISNREKRDPYSFENGAIFTGEWIGEERDGQGTQKWPDGAEYNGKTFPTTKLTFYRGMEK